MPARQFVGHAVTQPPEFNEVEGFLDALVDFLARHPVYLEAIANILRNRHVWENRIGLEHHVNRPPVGLNIAHVLAINDDSAFSRRLKTGQHAQQGCFAAARRAEQRKKLTTVYFQRDIVYGLDVTAVNLGDVSDFDDRCSGRAVTGHTSLLATCCFGSGAGAPER